jgi:hypothetical protein
MCSMCVRACLQIIHQQSLAEACLAVEQDRLRKIGRWPRRSRGHVAHERAERDV